MSFQKQEALTDNIRSITGNNLESDVQRQLKRGELSTIKTSYRRPETRNYPYKTPWTSKQIDSVIMLTEPIPTHHVDSDLSVENNPDQKSKLNVEH